MHIRNSWKSSRSRQSLRDWAIALICLLLFVWMTGCATPVQNPKASEAFESLAPVVMVIERYHKDKRIYPRRLVDLVPDYIPQVPRMVNKRPIIYKPTEKGKAFTLTFQYLDPDMNFCTYSSLEKNWDCQDYY